MGFRREGEREKERACVSEQKRRKEGGNREGNRKLRCEEHERVAPPGLSTQQNARRPLATTETGKMSARCRFRSQLSLSTSPKGCD